ncbi:hypothetical protein OAP14_02490 [Aliiglaciecola sp.]|nr:hypothetical protein [Aliiglaciecola sp.]
MSNKSNPITNMTSILDVSGFTEFDVQVRDQFMPITQGLYHQTLLLEDTPQHYLQQHYDIDIEKIQKYKLGFCNRSLVTKMPHHRSQDGVKIRSALSRFKILRPSGHENYRGCITVPIFHKGEIVAYYGERISRVRRGSSQSYWHPFDKPAIFNVEGVPETKTLFMCQSPLLAIKMMEAFDDKVIATDSNFNMCSKDISCLVDKGVETLIVVKSVEPSKSCIASLSKSLAKFGITYQSFSYTHGGQYGRA